MREPTVLTVSQVNFFVKSLLEGEERLAHCFVLGEIADFTDRYESGHLYLSLKDERAVLRAVMFASAARRLRFKPKNGMKVLVRGRVSVYEVTGQYRLSIEDMQPYGVGARALGLEQLTERLREEGLFDEGRKRPLPRYPRCIAVVTSPAGAALQDILQVTGRRWPLAAIDLYPVQVQGEGAAARLTAAVRRAGADGRADVLILGRGGGASDDLWAFNDEALVRAVAASPIPVVSAVGHQTDVPLCDFAADVRAPTPSAAAELCTPDRQEEELRVAGLTARLCRCAQDRIDNARVRVDVLRRDLNRCRPDVRLHRECERVSSLEGRLRGAAWRLLRERRARFEGLAGKLDALSPFRVFARGYAAVYNEDRQCAVASVQDAAAGETLRIRLTDGALRCKTEEKI